MKTLYDPCIQQKISNNFSKATSTYDSYAHLQQKTGLALLKTLRTLGQQGVIPLSFKHLLDIGCGTGWLTQKTAQYYQAHEIQGIDLSPTMVAYAQQTHAHPRINYSVANASQLKNFPPQSYDLIISNLCLHWVEPLVDCCKSISLLLKPKGIIAGTLMLKGTMAEWEKIREQVTGQISPKWLKKMTKIKEIEKQLASDLKSLCLKEWTETKIFLSLKHFLKEQRGIGATDPFNNLSLITKPQYRALGKAFHPSKLISYKIALFVWKKNEQGT